MKMISALYSLKAWQGVHASLTHLLYQVDSVSHVFRRQGRMVLLQRWFKPFDPKSDGQQNNRSMFALAVLGWQGLPMASRQAWDAEQGRRQRPVMSGYNLYISKYLLTGGNPKLP